MTRGCHVRFREQPGGGNSLRLTRLAVSDSGGEHAAVLYSLIGTCRLNNVEPWNQKNGCITSLNISKTGRQTGYAICDPTHVIWTQA